MFFQSINFKLDNAITMLFVCFFSKNAKYRMYLIVSKQSLRATCKKVKPACAFAQTLQMISPCSTTLFGFLSYKRSKKKNLKADFNTHIYIR